MATTSIPGLRCISEMTSRSGRLLGHLPFSAWISGSFSHESAVGQSLQCPGGKAPDFANLAPLPSPGPVCAPGRREAGQGSCWPSDGGAGWLSPPGQHQLPIEPPLSLSPGLLRQLRGCLLMYQALAAGLLCMGSPQHVSAPRGSQCHVGEQP